MNKYSLLLWVTVILMGAFIVTYNFHPELFYYSDTKEPTGARLVVVNEGLRNQPYIVEPGVMYTFLDHDKIIYDEFIQPATQQIRLAYYFAIFLMLLIFGMFIIKAYFIYKKFKEGKVRFDPFG